MVLAHDAGSKISPRFISMNCAGQNYTPVHKAQLPEKPDQASAEVVLPFSGTELSWADNYGFFFFHGSVVLAVDCTVYMQNCEPAFNFSFGDWHSDQVWNNYECVIRPEAILCS